MLEHQRDSLTSKVIQMTDVTLTRGQPFKIFFFFAITKRQITTSKSVTHEELKQQMLTW